MTLILARGAWCVPDGVLAENKIYNITHGDDTNKV